jgi:hypothetical protein
MLRKSRIAFQGVTAKSPKTSLRDITQKFNISQIDGNPIHDIVYEFPKAGGHND